MHITKGEMESCSLSGGGNYLGMILRKERKGKERKVSVLLVGCD